jgi:phospholipid transport system substrate-binding protein
VFASPFERHLLFLCYQFGLRGGLALSLLAWLVLAGPAHANADLAETVRLSVEKNVQELIADFNREKARYQEDPSGFLRRMDDSLTQIVDFRRIAARVMGKFARQASAAQKDRFVEVFKTSLYQTYTKTLVESGAFEIRVTRATINSRSEERASVDLEVVSDNGTIFPVVYSMFLNEQKKWMLENVIVFGVNVGLAFRDRFEAQYREHRGNIDAVIDGWTTTLDIHRPEPDPKTPGAPDVRVDSSGAES